MRSIITSFILVLCFLASNTLSSQKISIQGTLKDINGKAVPDNQSQSVTFKIYDAVTGGNVIWTKDTTVAVNGGVYSHYLGGNPALTGEMFTGARWLSVTVNGVELTPRTELSYAPYALSVSSAQTALGISKSNSSIAIESDGDITVMRNTTENLIIKTDGKVGIGATPKNKLDIEGGIAVGTTYSGHATFTAPTDGAIIQGSVGIGTNSPQNKLDIEGGIAVGTAYSGNTNLTAPDNGAIIEGDVRIGVGADVNGSKLTINDENPQIQLVDNGSLTSRGFISLLGNDLKIGTNTENDNGLFIVKTNGGDRVTVDEVGRVGIGTSNPSAPLHISLSSQWYTVPNQSRTYFTESNLTNLSHNTSGSAEIAVRAVGWYWAENGGFLATSDKRIKNIIGVTENKLDLKTLNKIQITDYTYIDKVSNASTTQKKVIAQQVNEVYPTAVKQMEGIIPNVYQIASKVKHTENETEISSTKLHDFAVGDKVKLILQDKGAIEVIIKKILATNTFVVDKIESDNIFIYGKHVDDLLTIDYDALSMLNISATQELYNRIVDLEAENQNLKTENKSLNEKQTNLENRLDKVEGFMKSIKASTTGLE